jgi:hypothetical protein
MTETKTEVQLKARATNWLLAALIAVVSWVGKKQNETLEGISTDLKTVSGTVQVHNSEIQNLKAANARLEDRILLGYERSVGKHEDFFEIPKRRQ